LRYETYYVNHGKKVLFDILELLRDDDDDAHIQNKEEERNDKELQKIF